MKASTTSVALTGFLGLVFGAWGGSIAGYHFGQRPLGKLQQQLAASRHAEVLSQEHILRLQATLASNNAAAEATADTHTKDLYARIARGERPSQDSFIREGKHLDQQWTPQALAALDLKRLREDPSYTPPPAPRASVARPQPKSLAEIVAEIKADPALRAPRTVEKEREAFLDEVAGKARPQANPVFRGRIYAGVGGGHWIDEVSGNGKTIKLEDGSVWEVEPVDWVDTALWLAVSDIIVKDSSNAVFPYLLINTSDGEKAHAKLIAD